ncbi:hypothetical protein BGLA2_2350003 [Burkholderia gladioli]|nr:hypothetical protein BGLA2_2350003 [Burkholderia gladioli]
MSPLCFFPSVHLLLPIDSGSPGTAWQVRRHLDDANAIRPARLAPAPDDWRDIDDADRP